MFEAKGLKRLILAALLAAALTTYAQAASPGQTNGVFQTKEQALTEALRQSLGAPARAELGDQAFVRLSEDLVIVPYDQAVKLLTMWDIPVPPDLKAMLIGPKGMNSPGLVRYVAAGFIDASEAHEWTGDDMLSSLRDTVEARNPARAEQKLQALEVRRWVRPPHYNPETHQIVWSALILPKSAPDDTDGEITFNVIGFGKQGYIQVSMVTSVQDAPDVSEMFDTFLSGLQFNPGSTYADAGPADPRAATGLAGALGMDSLHRSRNMVSFWMSDLVIPVTGGIVGLIGAVSLLVYFHHNRRKNTRRW